MDLVERTAIVTGGGSGLGAHLVTVLAAAGCHVLVADRDARSAERVACGVGSTGGTATPVRCDVLADRDLEALVVLAESLGGVDVLVNTAGGWGDGAEQYPDAPVEDWSAVLDLNLRAPMLLTQLCLPSMRARGEGAVVNVSSSAAVGSGAYGGPPYAAAKAGLLRFTTSLAALQGDGVRVTCVVPGWVGLERAHAEWGALDAAARTALPALVPPVLVADEVVGLVRDDAPGGTVVSLLDGEVRLVTAPG